MTGLSASDGLSRSTIYTKASQSICAIVRSWSSLWRTILLSHILAASRKIVIARPNTPAEM